MVRQKSREPQGFARGYFRGVGRKVGRGVGIRPERQPGVINAWNAEEERE